MEHPAIADTELDMVGLDTVDTVDTAPDTVDTVGTAGTAGLATANLGTADTTGTVVMVGMNQGVSCTAPYSFYSHQI